MVVLTIDEVGELLDGIAESLPPQVFEGLNGGINLREEKLTRPEIPAEQMLVMGRYFTGPMGRYIDLYYGSFAATARKEFWDLEDWKRELRHTLTHELTHHLESLGGVRDLEEDDEVHMAHYRRLFGLDN